MRAGQWTGPPNTSAWAVIWSGIVGKYSDDSRISLIHKFVAISSRREGPFDCWDLSLFQLSLLGQEGGGKLKYA